MKTAIRNILVSVAALLMATACSTDDYVGVVPANCTALMSIDIPQLAETQKGVDARLMRTFFRVASPDGCGIDVGSKLYLFETIDGTMGLVARVKDEKEVGEWLTKLQGQGVCKPQKTHQGKHFTVIDGAWVAGYDNRAMLVMGPSVPTAQPTLMRRMIKMLDEDSNIQDAPIYGKLGETDAPMALVAQAQALPEQLVPLCTLGAPDGTSPDKVMLAATMTEKDGCMILNGETFSFDKTVDEELKKAAQTYRKMKGTLAKQIPSNIVYAILANVDGQNFLPLLRENKQVGGMLAGMGTKVDVETFMGNIDGDMVFAFSSPQGGLENMRMQWAADMRKDPKPLDDDSRKWLEDNRLGTATAGEGSAFLPEKVIQAIDGKRMATIIGLSALSGNGGETGGKSLLPINLFDKVDYIIYTIGE